jgi:excisionase family DNA binding protein
MSGIRRLSRRVLFGAERFPKPCEEPLPDAYKNGGIPDRTVRCAAYPAGMPTRELLSAQEIAARIGVTDRTVRRWIKSGELSAKRTGRAYEIDLEEARSLAPLSSTGHRRSSELAAALSKQERDYALLEGRYIELKEQYDKLERTLVTEREKRVELETRLALARPNTLSVAR